jgi:hypothetical protein
MWHCHRLWLQWTNCSSGEDSHVKLILNWESYSCMYLTQWLVHVVSVHIILVFVPVTTCCLFLVMLMWAVTWNGQQISWQMPSSSPKKNSYFILRPVRTLINHTLYYRLRNFSYFFVQIPPGLVIAPNFTNFHRYLISQDCTLMMVNHLDIYESFVAHNVHCLCCIWHMPLYSSGILRTTSRK